MAKPKAMQEIAKPSTLIKSSTDTIVCRPPFDVFHSKVIYVIRGSQSLCNRGHNRLPVLVVPFSSISENITNEYPNIEINIFFQGGSLRGSLTGGGAKILLSITFF